MGQALPRRLRRFARLLAAILRRIDDAGHIAEVRLKPRESRLKFLAAELERAEHRVQVPEFFEESESDCHLLGRALHAADKVEMNQAVIGMKFDPANFLAHSRRPDKAISLAQVSLLVLFADRQTDVLAEELLNLRQMMIQL